MTPHDRSAIVVAARRSPIGKAFGDLKDLTVDRLAAPVIVAVLADAGAPPVDEVVLGNAAGPGGNLARLALLAAGLPVSVPGVTVDRQCGSGLEAINIAARLIESGAADVVVAGGVESVSTAASPNYRARFAPDAIGDPDMGEAAENVVRAAGISRARQDAFALRSHHKAVASQNMGRFDAEIVPLGSIARDQCPRAETSMEALAKLPPVFRPDGTVTAGNACPRNDGASAVVVMSHRAYRARKMSGGMWLVDSAAAGVEPALLGLGPVPATQKLLARTGFEVGQIDLIEFNEAFAGQVIACLDRLGLMEDQVNVGGGALALGHPYGASGATLIVRLFTEIVRRDGGELGLATIGIGGGMGLATLVRRLD
jgi:acetyl-CoA C-acetyltransferase